MEPSAPSFSVRLPSRTSAWQIAMAYALVGAIWVLGSGWLVHRYVQDPPWAARVEVFKGWCFVGVTAMLLGAALDRYFRAIRESARLLRQSDACYRALFKEASDGILLMPPDGSRLQVNPAFARMHGYAPREMESMRLRDLLTPATAAQALERLRRAEAGEPSEFEVEHRRKDGSTFGLSVTVSRLELGGQPCLLALHRDIHAHKQAEEAARRSQERLNFALQASHTGAWSLNLEDRTATRTEIHAQIFGYPTAEGDWSLDRFLAHVVPEDRELVQQQLQAGVASHSGWSFECRIRRADDQVRWVFIAGGFEPDAGSPGISGIIQDITERKQAQNRERNRRQILELLVSGEPLPEILKAIALGVEMDQPSALCSILLMDESGRRLWHGAAPSLPDFYNEAIHGVTIGAGVGSCGTAAHLKQRVIVEDIQTHPYWAGFRDLAQQAGLRSCWSEPILAGQGKVLGTFAIYHREPQAPQPEDLALIRDFADLTRLAIERKQAQEALRLSEAQLRAVVNTLPDPVWLKDAQGVYLACNARFESLYGATVAEIVGKTDYDFVDRAMADSFRANDQAAMAAGGPRLNEEELHFASDGHREVMETTKAPMFDGEGRLIGVLGIAHNVTERKQLEAELRQLNLGLEQRVAERTAALQASEERLALAFRATQDGIWDWHLETGEVFYSGRYKSMLGYEEAEIEHHVSAWQRLLHPDDRARAQDVVAGVLRGEREYVMEFRMRHKDGHYVDVLSRGFPLQREPGGPIVRIVGTHYDLTERKQAEAQLQKLWHAVEHSPASVMITDCQGTIEYVNPQFERDTGYTAAESLGHNPRFLQSGIHPPEFYAALWQALLSGQTWRGEICNRRQDGSLYWELAAIAPILDGAGRTTHFVAIKEDITERRRVAEELRQARDQAQAANRAKSVFLANMSHEIRTPMNAVLGFTQLLLQDPHASPAQRERLTTIQRSGEHLLEIINEILELARIESGRASLNPVNFDLSGLLQDLDAMFSLRAQARNLAFGVELTPTVVPPLFGDRTKLRQVCINLLGNAFKFTPDGGRVTLRMALTSEPGGTARLRGQVEDTGPGLQPEEAARLGEPFFQTAAGQVAGGTGLGLTISREALRLMGGDLAVRTGELGGACFEFEARLRLASAPAEAESAPPPPVRRLVPACVGYRVLVVDDVPDSRDVLAGLLEPLGFGVRTVANGLEAVERCRTWAPALVILDLRMPVMDGVEAARRLRAEHGPGLKLLVLSANVAVEARAQALAAGADEFMHKPVQHAALLERIRTLAGVAYEYRAQPWESCVPEHRSAAEVGRDSLGRLPAALVAALRTASAVADYGQLLTLVEVVSRLDTSLGEELQRMVQHFDYASLDALLGPDHASEPPQSETAAHPEAHRRDGNPAAAS